MRCGAVMVASGHRAARVRIADAVHASEEGALLIIGGAGSGKSTCLELAAVDSPLATVTLRVNPAEAGWALAGLDALLCLIGDGIHEQAVRDFVPSVRSATPLVDTARATLGVIRSLGLSPLVALIDDIDQMDEASQVIIGFLVNRLHHTNLRIIATASAEPPLSNVGRMDAVHLGDMDVCDLSAIALHLLGEMADRGVAVALARYAGGNPRALTQLGMQLSPAEARGTAALSLPPRATAIATNLATQRCADLPTASRAMLTRLAAAPVAPLAVMVRTDSVEADSMRDLIERGFVESRGHLVCAKDALVRSHLYWSLTSQERREIHERGAAEAHDDIRLARWHASFCPSTDLTPEQLLEAAVAFAQQTEHDAAVEYAERARHIAEGEAFGGELFLDLSQWLFLGDELDLAARYARVARGMTLAPAAHLRWALLSLKIEFTRSQRVIDLELDAHLAEYVAVSPEGASELLAVAAICHAVRGETEAARRLLVRFSTVAELPTLPVVDAARQLVLALSGMRPATVADVHAMTGAAAVEVVVAASIAILADDSRRARSICAILLARSDVDPMWEHAARRLSTRAEIRCGQFTSARTRRAPSNARSRLTLGASYEVAEDAWIAYANDDIAAAVGIVASQLERSHDEIGPAARVHLYALRGELGLLEDDLDAAVSALGQADLASRALDSPIGHYIPDLVEAYSRVGRLAEVLPTIHRFASRVSLDASRWAALAWARISAFTVADEHAVSVLEQALAAASPDDSPVDLGRTHLLLAERLSTLSRSDDAHRQYRAARDSFEAAGARAWSRCVDRRCELWESARADAGVHPFVESLSPEQRCIVERVQQGDRNKEIAQRMHLAVRTIELRLTRIYRLAGVHSRAELIALLGPFTSQRY